jgi:glycogen debranching enzyme
MFIALPGTTLSSNDPGLFEAIMETGEKAIRNFMAKEPLDCAITDMEAPDVLLWAIWAIQEYDRECGREACLKKYGKLVFDMIYFIRNQRHTNLLLHQNGLLWTDGRDRPVSWMNSTLYGRPLVPRTGYLVEFNALWYNALRLGAELAESAGKPALKTELDNLANLTAEASCRFF